MANVDENQPKVSVVIPVFNDQSGINECLEAIAAQSYPTACIEVIVVDNGSHPPIVIDNRDTQFVKRIRCDTVGSYAARNAGTEAATGTIVAFTDADCVPDPGWLGAGVSTLRGRARPSIVGGDVQFRLSDRPSAVELYQSMEGFDQRGNITKRGFTVTANLFVEADALRRIGPFDEQLLSGGDLDWSQRAVAAGYELVYAADAVVVTRPRTTLAAAARQARRVAGGRRAIRAGETPVVDAGPRRGALASIRRILGHSEFGWWDRLRVLSVASLLYLVRVAEVVMLSIGRDPERR